MPAYVSIAKTVRHLTGGRPVSPGERVSLPAKTGDSVTWLLRQPTAAQRPESTSTPDQEV